MYLKTLTTVTLAALAFATVCFAQGSVFSLDGGSQVSTVNPWKGVTSFNFTNSSFLNTVAPPTAPNGNICVNLYVYDRTPAQVLCCSCLVKTFQTINLAITQELERIGRVSGVSAFALATPGSTTCPSPSTVTQGSIIPFGFAAWKRVDNPAFDFSDELVEETQFTPFILGPQTTAQLTAACTTAALKTCTSCTPGAQ
jgi:hypothetical protein